MPKLVDHAAREVEVARAAWRVLVRDGVGRVSVRSVAAEAGLATGSLRRAFPTQQALLVFCLELVGRRVRERTAALPGGLPAADAVRALLAELLPLDAERRMEMEVFLHIGSLAPTDPALRRVYDAAHAELAGACRSCVEALTAGRDDPALDAGFEARRLHALVDGLALHLLRQPEEVAGTWATDLLERHVSALGAGAG
ncbi:TetR/AcrR family transcriptional regulator [Kineococcus sp. NUM-3379]